jgi:hypothetical protein
LVSWPLGGRMTDCTGGVPWPDDCPMSR